jgi:hypothetical protein
VIILYIGSAIISYSFLRTLILTVVFNYGVEAFAVIMLLVGCLVAILPKDSEFNKDTAGFVVGGVLSTYIIGFLLSVF